MTIVTADLIIRNGSVVSHDAIIAASVAIKDGRVLSVGAAEAMPPAQETFDATGLHILPGAIDVHVHFRDPGYPAKENWASGTAAAAFGGVTTVFDMPNTISPTGDAEALAAKHEIAASKASIDFGLYGLLGEDTIEHVPALVRGGVIGFKLYMGNTFGKIPRLQPAQCLKHSRSFADGQTIRCMPRQFDHGAAPGAVGSGGSAGPIGPHRIRPAVVAVEAVSRAAILANGPALGYIFCTSRRQSNYGRCARARRAALISPAKLAPIICCSDR